VAEDESPSLEAVLGPDFEWSALVEAEVVRVPPPASGPILLIVSGLILLAAAAGNLGPIGVPLGLLTIAFAIGWWIWKKPTYQLRLATRGGESVPFESKSREEADRLAVAIQKEAASRAPEDRVRDGVAPS
jgi:hypothetical protein